MADYNDLALAAWNTAAQLGTAAMSYGTHKADRKFNAAQAQIQRDFQLEMWNLANAYNSPSAQMSRLKEAGLNPNLVYGDGATTLAAHVGNAASASAPADSTRYPDLGAAVLGAVQAAKTKAEIDYVESEELVNRERAKSIKSEREGTELENMWNKDSYQIRLDKLEAENDLTRALYKTELDKQDEILANVDKIKADRDYIVSKTSNEKIITDAQIREINQVIDNSIKVTAATVTKLNADARKANADAWLANCEAQIKSRKEYQNAVVEKAVQDAYAAYCNANQQELEEALLRFRNSMLPEKDSGAYEYQQFIERWITPATSSLGKILGGSAGISYKVGK